MMDMTGNITQMMWKPPLIKLTHVPIPGGCEEAHDVFVDPQAISYIGRMIPRFNKAGGEQIQGAEVATFVHCCHYHLFVEESPSIVAMRRDAALGHESRPKAA